MWEGKVLWQGTGDGAQGITNWHWQRGTRKWSASRPVRFSVYITGYRRLGSTIDHMGFHWACVVQTYAYAYPLSTTR